MGIWFNPLRKSSNISSLSTFQNKCLRLIGGAFKATPSFLLESELFLLPLDLYFKFRTACFLSSIQTSSLKTLLDNIFSNISHCLFCEETFKGILNYLPLLEVHLVKPINY